MPDPLPSDVVTRLKSDPTAALAAALILAGSFPDLVSWAVRVFDPRDPKPGGSNGELKANAAGGSNGVAKRPGAKKAARANGHHAPRESAAKHDQALLALLQANPDASVTEIIQMNGRPRNSTMLSLERLQKAGFVEHAGRGSWVAVDPDLLEAPAPRPAGWIAPLSGSHAAKHTAAGRVPDRLTAEGA